MRSATNAARPLARAKQPANAFNYSEKDTIMTSSEKNSTGKSQPFIGEALKIAELVQYQKNSVVSKQILVKKAGTLTLFAFDQGEGLSEHTAPYDASTARQRSQSAGKSISSQ
jgi:hypothetical protein